MQLNKEIIEKRTGLKLQELPENVRHEVGKTYYSGYWGETYTVTDYAENTGDWRVWSVTCQWESGRVTEHCTGLDRRRDYLVITE